ncbi:MAG: phosphomethylpyrimidine synthase ThiC [Bacillota bacterium]
MTQLEMARQGMISPAMIRVAEEEGLSPEQVRGAVAAGTTVIPANPDHGALLPRGIGAELRTKVNANLGVSTEFPNLEREEAKLQAALEAGADALMDLSTGDPEVVARCRRLVLEASPVPVGTVPVYEAAVRAQARHGSIVQMDAGELWEVIEEHAASGVDFVTVHCGVTRYALERLRREGRITDVVSRGGALLIGWMLHHGQENPLYERFDRLLEIARRHDVTLSLGDGMRPGCLADATDRAQTEELLTLGELVDEARRAGVQVMVEGPGHVPLPQIEANVRLQKRLCHGAPFYVLGPLVTDVAPGWDHVTAAIGGALAGAAGADFICYVTPAEHLGLPDPEEVREGVVAARIAAHAADLAKGIALAWEWDREMARARKALDWARQLELAIDPQRARSLWERKNPGVAADCRVECSMCGPYCAMRLVSEFLEDSGILRQAGTEQEGGRTCRSR